MSKKLKTEARDYPKVFETFRSIGSFELMNLTKKEPTCFNGAVEVNKYRITIEKVDEPNEVIAERLQKLWDDCDNMHHWTPLKRAAEKIGYTLVGEVGKNRKRGGSF